VLNRRHSIILRAQTAASLLARQEGGFLPFASPVACVKREVALTESQRPQHTRRPVSFGVVHASAILICAHVPTPCNTHSLALPAAETSAPERQSSLAALFALRKRAASRGIDLEQERRRTSGRDSGRDRKDSEQEYGTRLVLSVDREQVCVCVGEISCVDNERVLMHMLVVC